MLIIIILPHVFISLDSHNLANIYFENFFNELMSECEVLLSRPIPLDLVAALL